MNLKRVFRFEKDDKVISLNKIDELACEFFDVEPKERHYASPSDLPMNWFEIIGGAVTESSHKELGYAKVIGLIIINSGYPEYLGATKHGKSFEELDRIRSVYMPYISFVKHLYGEGYEIKVFDK